MSSMSIQELYDYLNSPEFQNVKNGNIFYNYYIYQYPAKNEYEMRRQLVVFKQNLERPTSFVNAMPCLMLHWRMTRRNLIWLPPN